jgi:hypothetical protein
LAQECSISAILQKLQLVESVIEISRHPLTTFPAKLDPTGTFGRHPLQLHQLLDRVTSTTHTIMLRNRAAYEPRLATLLDDVAGQAPRRIRAMFA